MKKIVLLILFYIPFINLPAQHRTDSIHIAHYDINLSIIDFSGQTINGYTTITATTQIDSIPYIFLDLREMQIDSIFVNYLLTNDYIYKNDKIKINLPENKSGDTFNFKIVYNGHPYNEEFFGGFYYVGNYAFNLGVGIHTIPHCLGSAWFPCVDEFTDKSTYTFHIRTPKEKMAVCGGLLIDSLYLSDSTRIWTWDLNQPIPTYLASVAVSNYQVYRDTFHGIERIIPIEIYTTPDVFQNISGSFQNLKQALRIFEHNFGPYVWQRVGYVSYPYSSGAMEHACNITYPLFAINGNTMYEFLLFHELLHAWFGNLITCSKPEEMWINEGFATFSDYLRFENLYGTNNYHSLIKIKTNDVLLNTHRTDGGFYALNHVPQEITYGSTSYDKGALIVYTLRNYLGDSLFFSGIRSLLSQNAFSNITSENLIASLSQSSGIDLSDFYEAWINQPGFLHFSIDSIVHIGSNNQYNIYIRQRLYHANHLGNNNKIDLTFFSPTRETYTTPFQFSGEYGIANVTIPFIPDFAVIDYYDKMPDACIDSNFTVSQNQKISCSIVNVSLTINSIQDTVFMRIENHLVAPDTIKKAQANIYRISDTHYWRIVHTTSSKLDGTVYFNYNNELDGNLLAGCTKNNIILLYRSEPSKDWQIIPSTQRGTSATGSLQTTSLLAGEYCLAIGNDSNATIKIQKNDIDIKIFPNPTSDYVDIVASELEMNIELISVEGKTLFSSTMTTSPTRLNLKKYSKGVYVLKIKQKNGNIIYSNVIKK